MSDAAKSNSEFEQSPLTRPEYIAAMVHLYRGEMHRALTWRQRLDTSTNWAIVTTGALLSFLFTDSSHETHIVAVLAILLAFFMLCYEARRFRYFDVWRSRVRKLEENFYAPLLRRDLTSPIENWGFLVAEDLTTPRFKISYVTALRARLIRNYIPIFGVLYGAWVVKLVLHPHPATTKDPAGHAASVLEVFRHLNVGPISGIVTLSVPLSLLLFLVYVAIFGKPRRSKDAAWWSMDSEDSVDEVS
jgi:uncharacterized membrane protein